MQYSRVALTTAASAGPDKGWSAGWRSSLSAVGPTGRWCDRLVPPLHMVIDPRLDDPVWSDRNTSLNFCSFGDNNLTMLNACMLYAPNVIFIFFLCS